MAFQIDSKTAKWLLQVNALSAHELKQTGTTDYLIEENAAKGLENGVKVAVIVQELFKTHGLPVPQYLSHLKVSNQTAAQLYNWNYLNEALKKLKFEIDPETKNMIINGDREHLAMTLRQLQQLHQADPDIEDSLDQSQQQSNRNNTRPQAEPLKQEEIDKSRQSLTLSRSEEAPPLIGLSKKTTNQHNSGVPKAKQRQIRQVQASKQSMGPAGQSESDLLQYVVQQLMSCIGISRQQAITLLEDNNKYLAHILVKGVKGEFSQIEQLMERWYKKIDFIVQKMIEQNDMCFFFLQVVKPTLLSKNQQVAQWGCRLLSRIAHQLANRDLLPLAYDWFVRQAGGLATTMLALTRHPKLNQHVVSFILEFSRYNVAEVFTVELKKITNQDQLTYVKFILLILEPLVQSKSTAEELLNAGAIDYWIQNSIKGAEGGKEGIELKLFCLELLTKLWKSYPMHIEETLDKVGAIMHLIKRGIREGSEVVRYTLLQLLFNLLDEFATKKNPFASIVYKKLTFLFIENHEELNMREFMLRNFTHIVSKYGSIPVEIFLQPFVKQIKIKENESYFLNVFDMEFITVAVSHPKLKPEIALEFFDLLAKIKLNNYDFTLLADQAMETLMDRFLGKELFLQYTAKLIKVSLAKFYNTFKHKKQKQAMNDSERLQAQKRAEIVNFVLTLLEKGPVLEQPFRIEDKQTGSMVTTNLYEQIKIYTIQVKIQIQRVIGTTHKGIQKILESFPNVQRDIKEALEAALQKEELESNMTSQNSKDGFRFPKLEPKYLSKDRDETSSQQSNLSQGTRYSQKAKQEFPQQDYTKFAEQDEQKFLKENGIGFKKKSRSRKPLEEAEVDPKVQEQLIKTKLKKEEEEKRKLQQQEKIEKRKEMLKNRIQKQLEQRNIMQGVKGFEKDVEVKVLFEENQINQKLLDEEEACRNININDEETRDSQSINIVLKKYASFLKKLFNRYSCGKLGKKDYFESESDTLAQLDLIRLCKQKNLEKNKQHIIELLKQSNNKNIKSVNLEGFHKFIQTLVVYIYVKDKLSTHSPMGELAKSILKKMAVGQNFKLEEEDDQTTRNLTEKVRYNPHIELPQGYKKIYEKVYEPKVECSYPTKKAIANNSFTTCYEVVNELLFDALKFQCLQEEVRFFEQARVIKKNVAIPPRPIKREKEQPVSLLQEREEVPSAKSKRPASNVKASILQRAASTRVNRNAANSSNPPNLSVQKQNSKPKAKVMNAAERKKMEQEEARRQKKQQQQEQFKRRQQQLKKRVQKMQEEKQKELSKQKEEKLAVREQEEEKQKREKQQKERYRKEQKEKLDKYRREKEDKEKEEKQKEKSIKQRQEEERKEKLKQQMKKEEIKRKEEAEKSKKEREMSQEKNRRKKQEEDKKKQILRETVQKKLEEEKEKYQVQKMYKELLKNIYQEQSIQTIFNTYKEELRSLFNYGRQYNEYKLGDKETGLEQRGWNTICQQFNLTDPSNANAIIKLNQKEKGRTAFLFQDFQEVLLSLAVKQKELQKELEDYQSALGTSENRLEDFMKRLRIPKDKQTMKDYFMGLKSSLKKREQMTVVGPGGQKQTWQVQPKQ